MQFLGNYPQYFDTKDIEKIDSLTFPSHVLQHLLFITKLKASNHKIYLLIDEYDHFANEILSFRFNEFNEMVGQNGFVRKFMKRLRLEHTVV